jgi:CubicO group peptidase (beta-lactamase class C family)
MKMRSSRRDFLKQGVGLAGYFSLSPRRQAADKKLETIIPQLLQEYSVPGLSIAIIENGKIGWSQGFGVRDTATRKPVTPETIFESASLSKPTFAYAVLKLVGINGFTLDTPLTEYLSEPFIPDEPRLQSITARMILSHTSGLPHGRNGEMPLRLLFKPGEKFQYSATGFDYLQKAVYTMTKQPLKSLMKKTVFDPFGMSDSNFGWRENYESQRALGYNGKGEAGHTFNEKYRTASDKWREAVSKSNPELSYPSAAAGMYGTAQDFARFMIETVRAAAPSASDSAHLSEKLLQEMLTPQIKVTKEVSWGLGWSLLQTKTDHAIWHWGNWNGLYQHFAVASQEGKTGIVIMTNSGNGLNLCKKLIPLTTDLDIKPTHRFFD